MQLYFIRHAQSENNHLYAETGTHSGPRRLPDPELTDLGRQQARVLAHFLRDHGCSKDRKAWDYDTQNLVGFGITHLYCSLMVRAVATGSIVSKVLGLPLVAWEELHEVGGIHRRVVETGERIGLPGKNRAYFEEHYPELVLPASLGEDGWWASRPSEDLEAGALRARRLLDQLHERHGGIYGVLLRTLYDLPWDYWFSLSNTGIARIDFHEDRTTVRYMNRLDFMPHDMVT